MKKILLSLCTFLYVSHGISQTTFEVVSIGSTYSPEMINSAMNTANLCGFHYSNERRTLYFKDGAVVQLFKKNEIPSLDDSCFIVKGADVNDYDNTWEISSSGHLIRRIAINPTK